MHGDIQISLNEARLTELSRAANAYANEVAGLRAAHPAKGVSLSARARNAVHVLVTSVLRMTPAKMGVAALRAWR